MINHHGKIGVAHGNSQLTEEDIALVFARPKVGIRSIKCLFHEGETYFKCSWCFANLARHHDDSTYFNFLFFSRKRLIGLIKSSVVCILVAFHCGFLQNIKSL